MSRHMRGRLERLGVQAGGTGQRDDPETRVRLREYLARLEQARRDGLLSEEDRSELRARINAERAKRSQKV
jgi:hypothetical protein